MSVWVILQRESVRMTTDRANSCKLAITKYSLPHFNVDYEESNSWRFKEF